MNHSSKTGTDRPRLSAMGMREASYLRGHTHADAAELDEAAS